MSSKPPSFSAWADEMNFTDSTLKSFLSDVDSGKKKIGDLETYITSAGKSTISFKGILKSTGSFLKTTGSILASMGTAFLVMKGISLAFKALDDYTHQYTRALENASITADEYAAQRSNVQALASEYDTLQSKIKELQALQSNGTITMQQEVELANLQNQSAELERQLDIQKQILDAKAQASADAAMSASKEEMSVIEMNQEKYGKVKGFFAGLWDYVDFSGKSEADKWNEGDTTQVGLVKKYMSELEGYEKNLEKVQNDLRNDANNSNLLKDEKELNEKITNTKGLLASGIETIQGWIDQSLDSNGNPLKGSESFVESLRDVVTEYQNYGKSLQEIDLNNLNNYFSSTSGKVMKDYLTGIVKESKNAKDALKAFEDTGMSLEELGVTESGFIRYFEDVVRSANEAKEAINSVDGSFEGVTDAFKSENQGAKWDSMASNIAKAKELIQQGLVGTDDFQTVAKWMSPDIINEEDYKYDADAYVAAWQNAYDKVSRWFDSENPLQSMYNFAQDLSSNGIANITYDANGALMEVTPTFKNTAEAADKLGVSVNAVETAMSKLEEYGFEFDDVMFSGKGLEDYKTSLEGIRSVYESLGSGREKYRYNKLLEGWDEEYAKYENDLSQLTEDQIVKIKFEYDMASLLSEIETLDDEWENGNRSAEVGASRIASRNQYREKREKDNKYDESTDTAYAKTYDTIESLQDKMNGADQKTVEKLQSQIAAVQDLQITFQDMFADGSVANWEQFLQLDSFHGIMKEIAEESNIAIEDLYDKLGLEMPKPKVEVDADTSKAENKIKNLENDPIKLKGTVDLTNRPTVSAEKMREAGWDSADGETATVYSTGFSNESGDKTVLVTPILPNGEVLSGDALSEYANEYLETGNDEHGVGIRTFIGEDSIEQSNRYAEALHLVQEAYYLSDDAQKQALSSLSEYSSEQLKSIDLTDNASSTMENSLMSLMNALGISKDSASEFIDVLSDMGLISVDVDTSKAEEKLETVNAFEFSQKVAELTMNDNATPYLKLWNELQANDKFTSLNATDQASYVIDVWNALTPEQKKAYLNGEITVTDGATGTIQTVEGALNKLPMNPSPKITATENATTVASLASFALSNINGKTAHTYIVTHKTTVGDNKLSGTAHLSGTLGGLYPIPKLSGRALSMGTLQDESWLKPSWRTSNSEVALTGEEGQELVVTRANRWFTVGDDGAEFASIPQGSIVFNAKQTKELLSKGRINSRGTAMIGGTAFATGGRLPVPGTNGYGYGTPSGSNSNSTSSSNSSSSNTSDQTKEFNEKIDEIEILLDRMEKSFERLTDSIETYSYDLTKQSEVSTQAMNQIRTNLGTLQQAYNRYIQEANSVGLDESWKKRIENGSINISEITDKDLKEKIDEFQKWFNKATDVQDKIAEMQKELLDLAVEKLDNIEKYFENRTDYNDSFGYLTPITLLQESLDKFTKELEKQVNDGVIKEGSNEWYESMESISKMQEKILEATLKKYQDIIDNLSRISDTLDNSIELKEARDEPILESDYSKQIDLNNKSIQEKYNKRQQLLKQQAIYDVGSAKYDEIAEEIADIDDDIYGLLTDIEELKDKIWEVRWQPFFDGQEALKDLIDETDTFRDLLDSDAFVGKNGGLTADGITNIALISQGMNAAKQSIRNYQEALKKLDEDLKAGNISTKEYDEQQKDFLEQIRDSVGVVEDYKDSITGLWQEMLGKENDVIQSSIDKHEELLDAKKRNDEYSKNVRKQQKDINAIQAQISALSGV